MTRRHCKSLVRHAALSLPPVPPPPIHTLPSYRAIHYHVPLYHVTVASFQATAGCLMTRFDFCTPLTLPRYPHTALPLHHPSSAPRPPLHSMPYHGTTLRNPPPVHALHNSPCTPLPCPTRVSCRQMRLTTCAPPLHTTTALHARVKLLHHSTTTCSPPVHATHITPPPAGNHV